jgi:hypothetical protein
MRTRWPPDLRGVSARRTLATRPPKRLDDALLVVTLSIPYMINVVTEPVLTAASARSTFPQAPVHLMFTKLSTRHRRKLL